MDNIMTILAPLLNSERVFGILRALLLLLVGYLGAKGSANVISGFISRKVPRHDTLQIKRVIFYAILALFLITALGEMGFKLGVVLGAAGVFSVAIGFASQTSMSNLISGLFLLGERPFVVGDVIRVGTTTGEVLSIDLLSIKLRTFDNLFVRLPNESLIKSEVTNLTKFPIRRVDLQLGVAYKEDLGQVRELLRAVAAANPLCLEEPKPLFIFSRFGASSLDIQFSVWAVKENFLELRNTIQEEIKNAFDAAGIEMPFPHQTLYAGSITEPFPIRIITDREDQEKPAAS